MYDMFGTAAGGFELCLEGPRGIRYGLFFDETGSGDRLQFNRQIAFTKNPRPTMLLTELDVNSRTSIMAEIKAPHSSNHPCLKLILFDDYIGYF